MKFGYIRVSIGDQNLELQIDALKEYGVDEIYEEKVTRTRQRRQQLTELLGKLRAGDTLVIWQLDRLGKTIKQLLALAENFAQKGIHLVSIRENLDTSIPGGKNIFLVFNALTQMEHSVISERTKAGMVSAQNSGRFVGRKPKEDKSVERALKMYFSNEFSIQDIIEATGLSRTTIYKYVRKHQSKG